DNLKHMASLAKGIDGIDPEYIRRRLSQPNPRLPEAERTALQRRQQLFEETEHQLRELSAANETALTALDDARVAIARIELNRPQANLAADLALLELRRSMGRAKRSDHRKGPHARYTRHRVLAPSRVRAVRGGHRRGAGAPCHSRAGRRCRAGPTGRCLGPGYPATDR